MQDRPKWRASHVAGLHATGCKSFTTSLPFIFKVLDANFGGAFDASCMLLRDKLAEADA